MATVRLSIHDAHRNPQMRKPPDPTPPLAGDAFGAPRLAGLATMDRSERDQALEPFAAAAPTHPDAALAFEGVAQAGLRRVPNGRASRGNLCGDLETGLGNNRQLRVRRHSRFMRGSSVEECIRVQRGGTLAVRLLGHGAALFRSVRDEVDGLTASVRAPGRSVNQPGSSGPVGFEEVCIDVRASAEPVNHSMDVKRPAGEERSSLPPARGCSQTREAPKPATGLRWHREAHFNRVDDGGKIVPADMCAPRGAIAHREDERFCCARTGVPREPTPVERSKAELNPMVEGCVTAEPARSTVPPDAAACD